MITSQRDVVFTPFMLRVGEVVEGSPPAPTELRMEPSNVRSIACAVDEWVELRTYAEQMVAEANAMLAPETERITLWDEFGEDVLAFQLGWREQGFRMFVNTDASGHYGQVEVGAGLQARAEKPVERTVLDDLIVNMLIRAKQAQVDR